jgi:hypothetical protein
LWVAVRLGVTGLEADIRRWIKEWNTDPKPFVWTKTADQILDTFAAYYGRLNDVPSRRMCHAQGEVLF